MTNKTGKPGSIQYLDASKRDLRLAMPTLSSYITINITHTGFFMPHVVSAKYSKSQKRSITIQILKAT